MVNNKTLNLIESIEKIIWKIDTYGKWIRKEPLTLAEKYFMQEKIKEWINETRSDRVGHP